MAWWRTVISPVHWKCRQHSCSLSRSYRLIWHRHIISGVIILYHAWNQNGHKPKSILYNLYRNTINSSLLFHAMAKCCLGNKVSPGNNDMFLWCHIPSQWSNNGDEFAAHLVMKISLTLNMWEPSYLGLTRTISCLLMPWLLVSPGHQQPWYWQCSTGRILFYLRKDFNYLCHINVEE